MLGIFASFLSGVISLITFSWLWNLLNYIQDVRKNNLNREKAKVKKLLGIESLGKRLHDIHIKDAEIIQSLDVVTLVKKIKSGEYSPKTVLQAYQKFALEAQKKLNCITAVIEEAEAECDALENQSSEDQLLYGVPICIKDDVAVRGYAQTLGCANRLETIQKEDSILVEVLRHQGAIPFVITNLPQTCISYECSNPIYGITQNPHKIGRTPGGSSGGNGALLGFKGSPVGIGSDLGGSIRIPSHFCGVVGYKPTCGRLSLRKNNDLLPGAELLSATFGPMGRDVKSVAYVMKALASNIHYELDESLTPMIFNDDAYNSKKKLRIGYFVHNGIFPAAPAVQRAVEVAGKHLQQLGHEIIDISESLKEIDLRIANELIVDCIVLDNCRSYKKNLENDVLDPCIRKQVYLMRLPDFMKKIIRFLVSFLDSNMAKSVEQLIGQKDVSTYYNKVCKRDKFREDMFSIWKKLKLDAVICPPCGVYSPPHYKFSESTFLASTYSALWNVVNYPAGVVPVTKVNEEDDKNLEKYYKTHCKEYLHKLSYNGLKNGIGLPVGVQVVALPFKDELCLNVMNQLENSLKGM